MNEPDTGRDPGVAPVTEAARPGAPPPVVKVGDSTPSGGTIETILGQSETAVVFTTADGQLRWHYRGRQGRVPEALRPAIARFDERMARIATAVPEEHRRTAYLLLGKALFRALDSEAPEDRLDAVFGPVDDFVTERCEQPARLAYLLSFVKAAAVLVGVLTVLLFFVTDPTGRDVLLGALAGALGATISVAQRGKLLAVDTEAPDAMVRLQAGSRAYLGAVFGAFLVVAVKADIVMGVADNSYALVVMAAAAGFSERLVPDLIRNLENSLGRPKDDA